MVNEIWYFEFEMINNFKLTILMAAVILSGLFILPARTQAVVSDIDGFIFCAGEGGFCSFSGTMEVRYGGTLDGVWYLSSLILTDGTPCTNAIFGDPAFGVSKSCYIPGELPPPPPPPPTDIDGFEFCALEGELCNFSGTLEVRYGGTLDGQWKLTSKVLTNGTPCTNAVFGDPAPGVHKSCYIPEGQPPPPPPGKRPVLIIPGIAGTDLFYNNQLSWPDLVRMFNTNDVFLLNELSLNDEGIDDSGLVNPGDIIREITLDFLPDTNIFASLITDLESAGYAAGDNYFVFPYDWRLNLVGSSSLLNDKIEQIKLLRDTDQVDIIAHSMGGLLVKNYLNDYGTQSVDKLIFVGTPHLGAPKAGKALLEGYDFEIPLLNEDTMKILANSFPSVYQLLPSQTYFDSFQGYIVPYSFFSTPPLNYNDTQEWLLDNGANEFLLGEAEGFFERDLAHLDFGEMNVYNIAGCKINTQAAYKYARGNNNITRIGYTTGDKTVPLISADAIILSPTHKYYVKNGNHGELPSTGGVKELIVGILSDEPILSENVSMSPLFCDINGKTLEWRSPVEVHIYSQGLHSGPMEWGLENSIPGVGYEILSEEKFIFLPTDEGQTYTIEAFGEASSTFDLLISENNNGEVLGTSVFNDVGITPESVIQLEISEGSLDQTIEVKFDDTSVFETVESTASLDPGESQDLTPPETEAVVSGVEGQNGWYKSDVEVSLNAIDDNSGVFVRRYSLDGGASFQDYVGPFVINQEGDTSVQYYSVDNAGNNEEVKSLELKIDKTPPEISAQFSLDAKDFIFEATDNLDPNHYVSCTSTTCEASDEAGNLTILSFQKNKILTTRTLKLTLVSYNRITANFPSNALVINLVEKFGVMADFDQGLWLKSKQVIYVDFNKNKNQSIVYTLNTNGTLTKEVVSGIKFLQISTENGSINLNY